MPQNAAITARIQGDPSDFKRSLTESDAAARSWAARMASMRQNVVREVTGTGPAAAGGFMSGIVSGAVFTRLATDVGIATAAVVGFDRALKAGDNLRDLRDGLEAVGKDIESVDQQLSNLERLAENPGVDFFQAATASKNLRALGYTAAESRSIILALGNALAATGEKDEALLSVVEALSKIMDKGEISEKQFVALVQTAPKIREAFKAMGVETGNDLAKLGTDTRQIVRAIIGELQKIPKVQADAGDYDRWSSNISSLRWQESMRRVSDVTKPELGTNPTIDAARNTNIEAPPVDPAAVEAARTKKLRAFEEERDLRRQIARFEEDGKNYATELRTRLEILTKTEKVMKELGISQDEATDLLREQVKYDSLLFEKAKLKKSLEDAADARAKAEKADEVEHPRRIRSLDQDPDARAERAFNRSHDLKKRWGTYENYLNRDPEPPSLRTEWKERGMFTGLDNFKKFRDDKNWGKVRSPEDRERIQHQERLVKSQDNSTEAQTLKRIEAQLKEINDNTAGSRKSKHEGLRRG